MQIFNRQINIMLDKLMEKVMKCPGETIDIFKFINLMSLDIICGKFKYLWFLNTENTK